MRSIFCGCKREMNVSLYYTPGSAPCRNVLLAAKAVGVKLDLKLVDLMKGDHMTPEYLKMNPCHTVPTLDDNGFYLWESRVIMTYLANKYGKDDSWYPKDPKKRALVDHRLWFDATVLYQRFADLYYPIIFTGAPYIEANAKKLDEAFKLLDNLLGESTFAAGDELTLADLALTASVTTVEACEFNVNKYPNVSKWLATCKSSIPGYQETNGNGVLAFKAMYEASKKK